MHIYLNIWLIESNPSTAWKIIRVINRVDPLLKVKWVENLEIFERELSLLSHQSNLITKSQIIFYPPSYSKTEIEATLTQFDFSQAEFPIIQELKTINQALLTDWLEKVLPSSED